MSQISRRQFLRMAAVMSGATLTACAPATQAPAPQEPATNAEQSKPTDNSAPAKKEEPAKPTETMAPVTETVTVSWWNPDILPWQDSYKKIADLVNQKYPNVKVEVGNVPEDGFNDKMTAALAANEAPDVWTWYYATDVARHGFLAEVDNYLQADGIDPKKLWFEICSLRAVYNGKRYGTPRDGVWTAVIYNKDLFDEFKVANPKEGWTAEEYVSTAKALTSEAKGTWGTMAGGPGSLNWDVGFCWNLKFEMNSEDGRQVKGFLDSPDSIWAIQWMIDLQDKWKVSPPSGMVQSLGDYPFGTGKVGMADSSAWGFDSVKALTFKYDQVGAPVKEAGTPVQGWGDSVQYYMWSKSTKKDAAWLVMKTASSIEGSTIPLQAGHWTSPCPQAWLDTGADKDFITGKWWVEAQKPTKVPNYLRSEYHFDCVQPEYEGIWTRYIENGEHDVAKLAKEAAENAQKCLDSRYAESS